MIRTGADFQVQEGFPLTGVIEFRRITVLYERFGNPPN